MAPGRTDCFLASIVAGMSLAGETQYILEQNPHPITVANTRFFGDSLQGGSLPVFNKATTPINDLLNG